MLSKSGRRSRASITPALMEEVMAEEAKPRTKAQVLDLLRKEGEKWASFVAGLRMIFWDRF